MSGLELMCRCSNEESAACDEVRARARAILKVKDDLELVNAAIVLLSLDGQFTFGWDQWGAISVRPFEKNPSEKITEPAWIQCDEPIDGLAAAIVHYYGESEAAA